jgi:hypothetical protein
MTSGPPALATWLLSHFALGANSESLIGDLIERYQHGRSPAWYWRQTVVTIGGSFIAQAWLHRWLAIGVVALDLWVLPDAYMRLHTRWIGLLDAAWYPRFIRWLASSAPDVIWRITMWLHPWALTSTVTYCFLLGSVAWILVRLRPRQGGLILTVLILSNVGQCAPYLRGGFLNWLHEPGNPISIFGFLWYATFVLVAIPSSILLGGRSFPMSRASTNERSQ